MENFFPVHKLPPVESMMLQIRDDGQYETWKYIEATFKNGLERAKARKLFSEAVKNWRKNKMKYCLKDNELIILYENGKIKENATQNQKECFYCVENPRECKGHAENRKYGGQYCDWMKCKYEEINA